MPFTPTPFINPHAKERPPPPAPPTPYQPGQTTSIICELILRGIFDKPNKGDATKQVRQAIAEILALDDSLIPILVDSRGAKRGSPYTYIFIDQSRTANMFSASDGPRWDLLEKWIPLLQAYDEDWEVCWSPRNQGRDSRCSIRVTGRSLEPNKRTPSDTLCAEIFTHVKGRFNNIRALSYFPCSNGITILLETPKTVDHFLENTPAIDFPGHDLEWSAANGYIHEINNPLELVIVGFDGSPCLAEDLLMWVASHPDSQGQSALLNHRYCGFNGSLFVFCMSDYTSTLSILNDRDGFAATFKDGAPNLKPPTPLYAFNSAPYSPRTTAQVVHEGAREVERGFNEMSARFNKLEKELKVDMAQVRTLTESNAVAVQSMTITVATMMKNVDKLSNRLIMAESRQNSQNLLTQIEMMILSIQAKPNPTTADFKRLDMLEKKAEAHRTRLAIAMDDDGDEDDDDDDAGPTLNMSRPRPSDGDNRTRTPKPRSILAPPATPTSLPRAPPTKPTAEPEVIGSSQDDDNLPQIPSPNQSPRTPSTQIFSEIAPRSPSKPSSSIRPPGPTSPLKRGTSPTPTNAQKRPRTGKLTFTIPPAQPNKPLTRQAQRFAEDQTQAQSQFPMQTQYQESQLDDIEMNG